MRMVIDPYSPDGNAFAIMGYVKKFLTLTNRLDEWPAVQMDMMKADYKHLCEVASSATGGVVTVASREHA